MQRMRRYLALRVARAETRAYRRGDDERSGGETRTWRESGGGSAWKRQRIGVGFLRDAKGILSAPELAVRGPRTIPHAARMAPRPQRIHKRGTIRAARQRATLKSLTAATASIQMDQAFVGGEGDVDKRFEPRPFSTAIGRYIRSDL